MFDVYREILYLQDGTISSVMFFEVKSPRRARVIGACVRPVAYVATISRPNIFYTPYVRMGRFVSSFNCWDGNSFRAPHDLRSGCSVKSWQKLERL